MISNESGGIGRNKSQKYNEDNLRIISQLRYFGDFFGEKSYKIVAEKFGWNEKKSYLCTPFGKRAAGKAESSTKDWRRKIKIEKF